MDLASLTHRMCKCVESNDLRTLFGLLYYKFRNIEVNKYTFLNRCATLCIGLPEYTYTYQNNITG